VEPAFLPVNETNAESRATIGRIASRNFRLVQRLLAQIERVLEINCLRTITAEVVGPSARARSAISEDLRRQVLKTTRLGVRGQQSASYRLPFPISDFQPSRPDSQQIPSKAPEDIQIRPLPLVVLG
jgi:hypothetical protein